MAPGRTGVVQIATTCLGVQVVCDVSKLYVLRQTRSRFLWRMLLAVGKPAPIRGIPAGLRTRYTYLSSVSRSGGTNASLRTASHAKSQSKSFTPACIACAMMESACVETMMFVSTMFFHMGSRPPCW